jgi:phage terminase small subunit
MIAQFGPNGEVVAVKGKPAVNPWLGVAREAEATITRVGGNFGLTPSDRTRLFSSVLAPIPTTPVAVEQPDISESFFTEGEDSSVN